MSDTPTPRWVTTAGYIVALAALVAILAIGIAVIAKLLYGWLW